MEPTALADLSRPRISS